MLKWKRAKKGARDKGLSSQAEMEKNQDDCGSDLNMVPESQAGCADV